MDESAIINSVLRLVAEASQSWTHQDVADLLGGRATLEIVPKFPDLRKKSDNNNRPLSDVRVSLIVDELKGASSRKELGEKLVEAQLTRKELEQVSRFLDLPVAKHDSVANLKLSIIEELIGSSLNSRAIRGS